MRQGFKNFAHTTLSLAMSTILWSNLSHAEVVEAENSPSKTNKPTVHKLQVITVQAHPLSQSENDLVQASNII